MGLFDFLRRLTGQTPPARSPANPPPLAQRAPAPPPVPIQPPRQQFKHEERLLNLVAATFMPLSAEQVKAQAAGAQFSGFFQFGRRDRIPGIEDPRTKLIDQAMVGQGLITPEALAHIHEVGRQMDALRPEGSTAHLISASAVEADRAARARVKAEKKAAAEQRKRDHAARVAHNRQTDIVFLGRGVSAGLADRRSNVEQLESRDLPILFTPSELAAAMELPIPRLRWLAFHADASTVCHYVHFPVPKKSGGERMLSAPHQQMAAAQRWVLENVLQKLPASDAAHGFVIGRSILTNALPHVGSQVVINCDLTDFFPTISVHRVMGLFRQVGYSPAVATLLALLVTECPRRKVLYNGRPWFVATGPRGLPQGACTSPALSNLIARRMDARFLGLGRALGFEYTRYADDLTFSSKTSSERVGYLIARVRHITADEGFAVNEKKTRVLRPAARQTVTGVVTNTSPAAPRKLRRQMRAILHKASKSSLAEQNRSKAAHIEEWLGGSIEFITMLNRRHGEPLKAQLKDLRQ